MLKKEINELIGSYNIVTDMIEQKFKDFSNVKEGQIYYELISYIENLKETILFPKDSRHIKNSFLVNTLAKEFSDIFEIKDKKIFLNIIVNSKNLIDALIKLIEKGTETLKKENITQTLNQKTILNNQNSINKNFKRR